MNPIPLPFPGGTSTLYPSDVPGAPLILWNTPAGEKSALAAVLAEQNAPAHHLVVTEIPDWDRDMSPWPAPSPFPGEGFSDFC